MACRIALLETEAKTHSREIVTMTSLIVAGKFLIVIRTTAKTVSLIFPRLSNKRQLNGIGVMYLKGTEILSALKAGNSLAITEQNGGIFLTGMTTTTDRSKTIRGISNRLKGKIGRYNLMKDALKGEKSLTIPFHEIMNAEK